MRKNGEGEWSLRGSVGGQVWNDGGGRWSYEVDGWNGMAPSWWHRGILFHHWRRGDGSRRPAQAPRFLARASPTSVHRSPAARCEVDASSRCRHPLRQRRVRPIPQPPAPPVGRPALEPRWVSAASPAVSGGRATPPRARGPCQGAGPPPLAKYSEESPI